MKKFWYFATLSNGQVEDSLEKCLEVWRDPSHESSCMDTTTTYEIIGEGQYRIFARGWWADVEYRCDRATDTWQVAVLDTNAYGRIAFADIVLAANQVIGMGEVPADKLVWLDTGGRIIDGAVEW